MIDPSCAHKPNCPSPPLLTNRASPACKVPSTTFQAGLAFFVQPVDAKTAIRKFGNPWEFIYLQPLRGSRELSSHLSAFHHKGDVDASWQE
jgi:hypothetical protein